MGARGRISRRKPRNAVRIPVEALGRLIIHEAAEDRGDSGGRPWMHVGVPAGNHGRLRDAADDGGGYHGKARETSGNVTSCRAFLLVPSFPVGAVEGSRGNPLKLQIVVVNSCGFRFPRNV